VSAAQDQRATCAAASLDDLRDARRWVVWRLVDRNGKRTKVPFSPQGGPAKANDPATWGTRREAEDAAQRNGIATGAEGGVGAQLGDLGDGFSLAGVDLDACRDPATETLADWALMVLGLLKSYCEGSPSGTGVKVYFLVRNADLAAVRQAMGNQHGRTWKRASGSGGHPPAIELHVSNRYFAVTDDAFVAPNGAPLPVRCVPLHTLMHLIQVLGPEFDGKSVEPSLIAAPRPAQQPSPQREPTPSAGGFAPEAPAKVAPCAAQPPATAAVAPPPAAQPVPAVPDALTSKVQAALDGDPRLAARWGGDVTGLTDASGSGVAMSLAAMMKARGFTAEETRGALASHPSEGVRRHAGDARAFARMWERTDAQAPPDVPPGLFSPSNADGWPAPSLALLDETRRAAPALPIAALGAWWAKIIQDGAEGANAPPDYVAAALFAVASAAIGNARWARVWEGWAEPPFLWCAAVGNPSAGKSPGMKVIAGTPLARVERALGAGHPEAMREWEAKVAQAKQKRAEWEQAVARAVKAGEDPPPKPAAADDPPAPSLQRLRTGDVTTEKVAHLLRDNPKGVVVYRDELAGFLGSFDRYSGGAGGGDRAAWLEAWSAGSLTVDRVKNPDPIHVPRFGVALLGSIQPDRLRVVTSGADDGLPTRFLWFWPEDGKPFGRPKVAASAERVAAALQRLAGLEMEPDGEGGMQPQVTPLDDAAAVLLEAAGREWQQRERQVGGPMIGVLGKARGNAVRLALVIEHLWWCGRDAVIGVPPPPSVVSAEAMRAAILLMEEYFLPMAERVFGDAALTPAQRAARTLLREIIRTRPAEINVRTVRNSARLPGLSTADDVKAAVAVLLEEDVLIPKPAPITERGGRPRGDYLVNPRLWEAAPAADGPEAA
jgi:hypothetical protein